MRKSLSRLVLTLICCCICAVTTLAQDFQKSYPFGQNGSISIGNGIVNLTEISRVTPLRGVVSAFQVSQK